MAAAGVREERSKSLRRKLLDSSDKSTEHERSKERSTSCKKYSARNNDTEDRIYHSNRNNKRRERYDDS